MTAVEVLALLLGLAGVIALWVIVLRLSQNLDVNTKRSNRLEYAIEGLGSIDKHLQRGAVALEKAASDRPAQQEARRLAEQNENLVLGISSVLDATLTLDEGAREDYAAGHTRGVNDVKTQLRAELNKALNQTN